MTPDSSNGGLREDIAGAICDATGLRGAVWAVVSDVSDEYALADAVMPVVEVETAQLRAELAAQPVTVDDTALIQQAAVALAAGAANDAKYYMEEARDVHKWAYAPMLAAKDTEIERLRSLWPLNGVGEETNVRQLVANHREWSRQLSAHLTEVADVAGCDGTYPAEVPGKVREVFGALRAELAAKDEETERWQRAYGDLANLVEQRIAALFPDQFPRYPGDSGTDDRCVGDHVPESLVAMVCGEVERLRADLADVRRATANSATPAFRLMLEGIEQMHASQVADRDRRIADLEARLGYRASQLGDARAARAALSDLLRGMARRVAELRPHVWAAEHRLGLIKQLNELVPKQMREIEQLRAEVAALRAQQAVALPEDTVGQIAARVHDVLCDCHDNGTGITLRSSDLNKIRVGIKPLIESWRPATEISVGDRVEWNPQGDRWEPAVVTGVNRHHLVIVLDDNGQYSTVERRHVRRPATESRAAVCGDEDIEDGLRYVCQEPAGHAGKHPRLFVGRVRPAAEPAEATPDAALREQLREDYLAECEISEDCEASRHVEDCPAHGARPVVDVLLPEAEQPTEGER